MSKSLLAALALGSSLLVGALPAPAYAWGQIGHAAVAEMAETLLTPQAKAEVIKLLAVEGYTHLSDIASWADEAKQEHLAGSPSHTIRLPLDGSAPSAHPCPGHFCADDAIQKYSAQLADRCQTLQQREIALKYVVHLVGDLHQPLHATQPSGSTTYVMFNGKKVNIHFVWDTGMIVQHGATASQIAAKLLTNHLTVAQSTPMGWAIEGRDIAVKSIYSQIPAYGTNPVILTPDYTEKNWPIVEERLTEAGIRLAGILNASLASR